MFALEVLPELAEKLEIFEKGLNFIGYVPIAGTFSSNVRRVLAVAEMVTAVALGVFAAGCFFTGNPMGAPAAYLAAKFAVHSAANEFRSYLETIPGVSLWTCLPYDLISYACLGGRIISYIV